MIVIVGCIVVIGAVLTGFTMAGGHIGALIHPSEIITIGGAALGALVVMSPKKVLGDLVKGLVKSLKGSPYTRQTYIELFKLWYHLLRIARRDGLLALESHIGCPSESSVFSHYPKIAGDHHAMDLICRALMPIVDGSTNAERLSRLLQAEIRAIEEEHHAPLGVLSKTADALPGFGIVAAVLGIVITMGAIDGPPEEIGEKVGAALVGTFLGILLSYGFCAPLAVRLEFLADAEVAFFRTIATIAVGVADNLNPKAVIEQACWGVASDYRLSREELEKIYQEVEAS